MLLQRCNRAGRGHARRRPAVLHVCVPRYKFHLVDLPLQHTQSIPLYPAGRDLSQAGFAQSSAGMHKGLAPVCKFILVDLAVRLHKEPRRTGHHRVLHHRLVQGVYVRLRVPCNVDQSVSRRASMHRIQRIQHKRIFSVRIQPFHLSVVFC